MRSELYHTRINIWRDDSKSDRQDRERVSGSTRGPTKKEVH